MDPNVTLKKIRELIGDGDSADVALVEAFEALDQWLSKGSFLPDDWQPKGRFALGLQAFWQSNGDTPITVVKDDGNLVDFVTGHHTIYSTACGNVVVK